MRLEHGPHSVASWLALLARLVVGGVWIWAGVVKVSDPDASIAAVRAYQLLAPGPADTVGRVLPMLEVVVGACLVLGLLARASGVLSTLMQAAFVVGIISVWNRGILIQCGCFGGGGADPDALSKYPWEVARDTGLLALSLLVVLVRRTPLAVDNLLFPSRTPAEKDRDVEEGT